MKVLWRSDAIANKVGQEVRVLDLDGEKVIEVAVPEEGTFLSRLVACLKYLFQKKPFATSFILTDEGFTDMCKKVVDSTT